MNVIIKFKGQVHCLIERKQIGFNCHDSASDKKFAIGKQNKVLKLFEQSQKENIAIEIGFTSSDTNDCFCLTKAYKVRSIEEYREGNKVYCIIKASREKLTLERLRFLGTRYPELIKDIKAVSGYSYESLKSFILTQKYTEDFFFSPYLKLREVALAVNKHFITKSWFLEVKQTINKNGVAIATCSIVNNFFIIEDQESKRVQQRQVKQRIFKVVFKVGDKGYRGEFILFGHDNQEGNLVDFSVLAHASLESYLNVVFSQGNINRIVDKFVVKSEYNISNR